MRGSEKNLILQLIQKGQVIKMRNQSLKRLQAPCGLNRAREVSADDRVSGFQTSCRGLAQHIVDRWRDAVSPGSPPFASDDEQTVDLLPCDISLDFPFRGAYRGV